MGIEVAGQRRGHGLAEVDVFDHHPATGAHGCDHAGQGLLAVGSKNLAAGADPVGEPAGDPTVGQFWSFPASQLYAETARLAAAGLLDEQREQGGRHRRYYTITDQGRQALGDWLGEPTSPPPELRHAGLLKLFFSELATTDELVALARAQEAWHREQLVAYQAIMDRYGHRPELDRRMAAARLIYAQAQTWVDFWADIAAHPPIVPPTR
ncbi:MAG TPA: PadR family transcriptional regulator [Actinomycetota bacterium]|nr:PadR family transcriptional regulator [Actinomycetota bacterium]